MEEQKMIYKKIADILNDVEAIAKDKKNTSQNYKFRGIDDVYNALHPLFKKNRVFVTTDVIDEKRERIDTEKEGKISSRFNVYLTVKFTYFAEDGSSVSSTTKGEAMDAGDKATNKAMSAAQKYSLIQMFLIPTEEGSPDSDAGDPKELEKMLHQIELITDVKGLEKYWKDNADYHKNDDFNAAVNKRKKTLLTPAK